MTRKNEKQNLQLYVGLSAMIVNYFCLLLKDPKLNTKSFHFKKLLIKSIKYVAYLIGLTLIRKIDHRFTIRQDIKKQKQKNRKHLNIQNCLLLKNYCD